MYSSQMTVFTGLRAYALLFLSGCKDFASMPFVLLLVLATRFDGKSIDRRADPNYTLIQMGKHTGLCALLYDEKDFINRFGNPEACLVEIRPEAPLPSNHWRFLCHQVGGG